jgi:hypothetical protein
MMLMGEVLALSNQYYYGGGDPMMAAGRNGMRYLATEVVASHPVAAGQPNAVTDWNVGRHAQLDPRAALFQGQSRASQAAASAAHRH